jgi:hypothetical protein
MHCEEKQTKVTHPAISKMWRRNLGLGASAFLRGHVVGVLCMAHGARRRCGGTWRGLKMGRKNAAPAPLCGKKRGRTVVCRKNIVYQTAGLNMGHMRRKPREARTFVAQTLASALNSFTGCAIHE